MKLKLPDIFQYSDFRVYLFDYFSACKRDDPDFSCTDLHRQLGIPQSRSYMGNVIKGRKVSPTFRERFIDVLNLSGVEADYFRLLVIHNQAVNGEMQELCSRFMEIYKMSKTEFSKKAWSVIHGPSAG
jgi:uncharacterized protein (TIGR02147 family)